MPGGYVGGRPKDESTLSRNPRQIRNRLRRAAKKQSKSFDADVAMLLEATGHRPIEEWDYEELARGRPRNADGQFKGPAPKWCTPLIAKEAKRRLLDITHGQLAGHVDQAVRTMANLMTSTEVDENGKPIVDAKTKFAAAAFIIEHVVGRPKALIEVTDAENTTMKAIASAIILDDGQPQGHLIIDGELADETDEEEEEEEDDDDI